MKIKNYKLKINLLTFILLALTFNFALLTFNFNKADASDLSLAIYPPILQIEANPPANITTPITIENQGEETVNLDIVFKPFTSEKENGQVSYLVNNQVQGEDPLIFKRMQILDDEHVVDKLTLSPGQQKTLTLHLGLPDKELSSDYYFSIVFLLNQSLEQNKNQALALGGIATNVLLSVGEKTKPTGSIEEFSVPFFIEKGPVPFKVRLKNMSEHYIMPNGTIFIKNMFGQIVGKVELLPVNILAGKIRAIPDLLQAPSATPSARMANFDSPFSYWNESFLLGPYTAILTVALSDQGPIFTKTVHFIGFPLQGLIGLGIAGALIFIVWKKVGKHLKE